MNETSEGLPERSEVEDALAAIASSGALGQRSRLGRLLDYLVTEELAGRGAQLKGYTIGTNVFDRAADFDPNADSIVRVEVNRLRQALAHHYATEGRESPLQIDIPKGKYRPQFTRAAPKPAPRPGLRTRLAVAFILAAAVGLGLFLVSDHEKVLGPGEFAGPRLLVPRFTASGDTETAGALAAGLTAELIADLTQYPFLSVASIPDTDNLPTLVDPERVGRDGAYLLTGDIAAQGDLLVLSASLATLPDLTVLWSGSFDELIRPKDVDGAGHRLATKVAETVGSAHGVVASLEGSTNMRMAAQ